MSVLYIENMGATCENCTSSQDEKANQLILESSKNYHLEPANFYNEFTRQVASKMGPFVYGDDQEG